MPLFDTLFSHPFRHRSHFGLVVVFGTVVISWALWLGSMAWYDDWYGDPWKYPAKIGSHSATLLMCWAFILATRFGPVEWLFGGLDKVYKAHRIVGETAFFLIFLHPIFLAMHRIGDGLGAYFGFFTAWEDPVRMTGLVALVWFAVLVVLSIYWKIAYHRWKRSHDFFGLLLVLIIVHGVWANGEIMRYPLLRTWFGVWCAVGLGAYIYIRIFYRWIGPQYDYRVSRTEQAGDDITEVWFKPIFKRRMNHRPGQFLYVSFDADAVSREPHPFTISSAPESPELRLSIKSLGDWTSSVAGVRDGEPARLWGPYGKLDKALWRAPDKRAVFLAGGIGVTPFLGILASEAMRRRPAPVVVIYSTKTPDEAVYRDELESHVAALPNARLTLHASDEDGFINHAWLSDELGNFGNTEFFICGPTAMNDAMKSLLLDAGVDLADLHFEVFSIR